MIDSDLNKYDGRKVKKSPEFLEKLRLGREKYWAEQRRLKALVPKLVKDAENFKDSVYEMAENQPKEIEVKLKKGDKVDAGYARDSVVRKIFNEKEKILKAQIEFAKGLSYVTADGKHVYTTKPDRAAGEYLLNQLIGKPKESIEVKSINLNVDL